MKQQKISIQSIKNLDIEQSTGPQQWPKQHNLYHLSLTVWHVYHVLQISTLEQRRENRFEIGTESIDAEPRWHDDKIKVVFTNKFHEPPLVFISLSSYATDDVIYASVSLRRTSFQALIDWLFVGLSMKFVQVKAREVTKTGFNLHYLYEGIQSDAYSFNARWLALGRV